MESLSPFSTQSFPVGFRHLILWFVLCAHEPSELCIGLGGLVPPPSRSTTTTAPLAVSEAVVLFPF